MVAFGVQPEFTCKLAVAGEEHGTNDADDVARVRFVGVLKIGSDGCIEGLFVHGATRGRVFSLLLTEGGVQKISVTAIVASPPLRFFQYHGAPHHPRRGKAIDDATQALADLAYLEQIKGEVSE